MAINQNDKVIRKINVGNTPHEISARYLGDYTYSEINEEFIKRLQGKSNNTSARTDPFKYINLGNASSVLENMARFSSWLDNLYDVNEKGEFVNGGIDLSKQGYYRINVNNQSSIEVQIVQMSSTLGAIMEIVKGPITIRNGSDNNTVSQMNYDNYNIYHRIHYDYKKDSGEHICYWTEWSSEQDITTELNKRIQGNSESSVNLDPFIKLSWQPRNKSGENDTTPDINDNMNLLCPSNNDTSFKTGHFRAYSSGGASCLDIKVDVLSWANDNGTKERFMQTVSGPVTLIDNNNKLYWVNTVPASGPGCYYRLSERAKTETVRTWSEWKPVNNSYIEPLQSKVHHQLTPPYYYSNPNLDIVDGGNNVYCFGYVGTLENINVYGDYILIDSISVYVRENYNNTENLDTPVWCRLLKFVNNTWVTVYQSTQSRTIRTIAPETLFSFKMKAIDDTNDANKLIRRNDKIAIVYVDSADAEVLSGVKFGFKSISKPGGLENKLANNSTGRHDWCPAFVIGYLPKDREQTFDGDIHIKNKTTITTNIDAGELKVRHYGTEKGFIIRTNNTGESIFPLEILTTNNTSSYQYNFPKANGDVILFKDVTHNDLLNLRNNSQLVPGGVYRITNYSIAFSLSNLSGANHQFDILVQALTKNKLSENAKACLHDGDTYFSTNGAKLESWELKYCLDNDTSRFGWAGSNDKGIIYYMKDEWGNEAPYDFKNILFKKNGVNYYTFSFSNNGSIEDATVTTKNVYNNKILPYYDLGDKNMVLNHNTFLLTNIRDHICAFNYIGQNCKDNTFGSNCICNTLESYCKNNTFGDSCQYNALEYSEYNIFGNNCKYNEFSECCTNNTFGDTCQYNEFGEYCASNTFGDSCQSNVFGVSCSYNKLGNNTMRVTFGSNCTNNTIGNNSQNIKFGDVNTRNVLGSYSLSITFGNSCTRNIILNGDPGVVDLGENFDPSSYLNVNSSYKPISYMRYITLGDAVQHNIFWTSVQTDSGNYVQMYNIESYIIRKKIELKSGLQAGYITKIAKNSLGSIKQYCEADLIA